ncbi:hypothetical protein RF11_14135 [Thelohanellus kitauei]|uniref:Uncharacterized protein n=1 Tax=Thelohanellus kitauei TaxID=669202 RepID=A0A0C2N7R0_THEKT|nr:hypothetical protein RF11_14135 [Thelohanellus kitauei]
MDVLYPCKPDGVQTETDIYVIDSFTTINTKFTTNMSFSTNKPVSSQTPNIQRTRFWTKRNMWIIFLIFYPNYLPLPKLMTPRYTREKITEHIDSSCCVYSFMLI